MIAVLLAAGEGRRMGQPKALLPWPEGPTLLEAHVRAALRVGCDRVVAVVRAHVADAIEPRIGTGAVLLVSTADDDLGPAGSIAAFVGRAGVRPPHDVIAIAPVDLVPGAWSALEPLARALVKDSVAVAARPMFDQRRGHPVLVRNAILDAYRSNLAAPRPLREVLASFGPRVVDVPVLEPRVASDLDTPEDVARWTAPR